MESSKQNWLHWLKQSYNQRPLEGPAAKRVKFSDVHEGLTAQFPSDNISIPTCSKVVQEVFPHTQRTRAGHERQRYVVGLERSGLELPEHDIPTDPMQTLRAENEQLSIKGATTRPTHAEVIMSKIGPRFQ